MSRGSKIGERRGGRDRGTPNRRTLLVDRILAIASECLATSAEGFIAVLVQDQKLPADLRMAIARGTSHTRAVHSSKNKRQKDKLVGREPSNNVSQASLKMFLGIVLDTTVAADQRRKAALEATNYLLPKKPGMERWWINAPVDEYGFVITPEIAAEYRDAKLELRYLPPSKSLDGGSRRRIEKLRARIKTILHRLQCPCPSLYGKDRLSADSTRLIYFLLQRENRTSLSAEENAEEAHLRARVDSYEHGPERAAQRSLYALNDKERIARQSGPRLTRKERIDLRFLRVLYSRLPPPRDPCSDELSLHDYQPLRDEPLAEDGNLYPADSKLREIEEDFVAIPKYCYPPHARMPPLKDDDVIYINSEGFRWSNKLLG